MWGCPNWAPHNMAKFDRLLTTPYCYCFDCWFPKICIESWICSENIFPPVQRSDTWSCTTFFPNRSLRTSHWSPGTHNLLKDLGISGCTILKDFTTKTNKTQLPICPQWSQQSQLSAQALGIKFSTSVHAYVDPHAYGSLVPWFMNNAFNISHKWEWKNMTPKGEGRR